VDEKVLENLKAAFAGESQAHVRYLIFAEEAKAKGLKNLARVFEAFAYSEYVHAKNHLKAMENVEDAVANLDKAIAGETYEIDEMYPKMHDEAIKAKERRAATSFRWAMETEKNHAEIYRKFRVLIASGRDKSIGQKFYVCSVCGYTVESEPPEVCPLCSAGKAMFREF
jgi:rubrerythrin